MDDGISTETDVAAARKLRSHGLLSVPRDSSRTRSPLRSGLDSDPDSESSKASSVSRGRAKGRGRGTGISRARVNLRKAKEEAKEEAFNQFLRDRVCRKRISEPVLDPEDFPLEAQKEDPTQLSAEELRAVAGKSVATIVQVATKSGHLKGSHAKLLKDSAAALQEMVDALASRTEAEETRRLRVDNGRLRQEVENLKTELKAHRREFSEMKATMAAANTTSVSSLSGELIEELKASIAISVGAMLDARFAGIEERLLPEKVHRPPLAADKSREMAAMQTVTAAPTARMGPMTRSFTVASKPAGTPETMAGPSRVEAREVNDWATVVKKGKKAKKTSPPTAGAATTPTVATAAKTSQPVKPKLTSPKTAAVVVTLQPEAAEKGVTYAKILEQAERQVNLEELGIGEGIKIRRAATGARLLELPKGQTAEQAELLASRLRTVLDGVASVVRPSKLATLRVTGLDDSVTKEKIIAAVVRAGNCPTESLKVGEVQSGPRGVGAAILHCPIEVAKVISEAGKLRVGWSSAEVHVLEQRPLRCFKCLGIGHTKPVCPSTANRGDLCFRCGGNGHKSLGCIAPMRCAVCKDAGLPSEHIMGGRSCNPPSVKGKMVSMAQAATSAGRRQAQEEAEMSS
ncbi:uncharacterized protein LOC123864711 [Maniola jurtina]|uniref:uncharacterized protein LOC123864711 n=1 Tax=Maniola jurtina TaxID=191418 RepID=UPI001E68644E|nr:uncharacterized protein LOC123864711 [Maniola jurtina]